MIPAAGGSSILADAPASGGRGASRRTRSRGHALVLLVLSLSVATMLLVYGSTTEVSRSVRADQRTRAVLEQARQALIGRAVGDASRPGSLPCPDSGDDGSADLFSGSNCPSYIGRLPWRTLGIGDLRDESGERLWYALSPSFRDHPAAPPINSDTRGTLAVFSGSENAPVTSEAVAVVFAPGSALPGQFRDAEAHTCSTSSRIVPRTRCPSNYLDVTGKIGNATAAGPYIAAPAGLSFNDKLAVIITADFMPLVERRVVLDVRNALLAYRQTNACACYPWADANGDGASDAGASRGRLPLRSVLPHNWPAGVLPTYVAANDWARVIHYAVGRSALESRGKHCSTCVDATLSLDGVSAYDVVLLAPGFATGSRVRNASADYFEDPENQDGDERFVTPRSPAGSRDSLFAIAAGSIECAARARALLDQAPCAEPGGFIRTACRAAADAASGCTCAAAARSLLTAPCATALGTAQCVTAADELRRCTS